MLKFHSQLYGSPSSERRSSERGYSASLDRMRSTCAVMAALSSIAMRWNSSPSPRKSSSDRVRMRSSKRFRGSTGRPDFVLLPAVPVPYRTLCRTSYVPTRRVSHRTTQQRPTYEPSKHLPSALKNSAGSAAGASRNPNGGRASGTGAHPPYVCRNPNRGRNLLHDKGLQPSQRLAYALEIPAYKT